MPTTKGPARKRDSHKPASSSSSASAEPMARWLTRLAFGLAVALVLARATALEVLRDTEVTPGSTPTARAPGPATSLVLDLLAWAPALLVLARGAVDRTFHVRFTWAHGLLIALALLALSSTFWSADKFAAAVSGFHFLSAAVFLWSASQLVRSWRHVRIVAGACLGLLLIYGAHSQWYYHVERAELAEDWRNNREARLHDQGIDPNSHAAKLFEAKVLRGDMIGFNASPNSFAAVSVLLMVISAGTIVQRLVDRDGVGWIVLPIAGIVLGACITVLTKSKTAWVTPYLAAGMLGAVALAGGWLTRHARLAYAGGVVCVVLGAAALVGHGLYHGTLFIDSMTFRWRYWVGAAKVFAAYPLIGVGWDNFGLHYLGARLPIATEEIRDPHNFFVRFSTELGAVGGLLCVAWMMRLWWELTTQTTRDAQLPETTDGERRKWLPPLGWIAAGATLLGILAFVDLAFASTGTEGRALVTLGVLSRVGWGLLLLAGMAVTCMRSLADPTFDERPAPWVLCAMIAGVAVFLVHNLVDFAMFEVGPMFLFALVTGAALGMRLRGRDAGDKGDASLRRPRLALAATAAAWVIAALALVAPVVLAEQHAAEGNEFLRAQSFDRAAKAYDDAFETVPYNADYAFRRARVPHGDAAAALDNAIRVNPLHARYVLYRAASEAQRPQPDVARVRADYDRALSLDPADIDMRLEYAKTLERFGLGAEANDQYEKALWYNNQLAPDDMERLSGETRTRINDTMSRLGP